MSPLDKQAAKIKRLQDQLHELMEGAAHAEAASILKRRVLVEVNKKLREATRILQEMAYGGERVGADYETLMQVSEKAKELIDKGVVK